MSSDTRAPELRADAERNRAKILDTAARLFADRGAEVTLNEIAHEAGCGVGTVYRRFPEKAALLEALSEQKLLVLEERIAEVAALPTVRETFLQLMMGAAEARAIDRGLFAVLFPANASTEVGAQFLRLLHSWDDLIERARLEGVVRRGFSSADIDLFMIMVGSVADATRSVDPDAWKRAAKVLLDGYAPPIGEDPIDELDLSDDERRRIFHS
ncbi:TetR/AcrR family transcriptional regulator [soil metagenome]